MRRQRNVSRDEPGFTVIEFLMVIMVLGILSGISIVNFDAIKRRARYTAIETILNQLMDAEELYFAEFNEYYPAGSRRILRRKGNATPIEALDFVFPEPQRYQYRISAVQRTDRRGRRIDSYTIRIDLDQDLNGNDRLDRFIAQTYLRDGTARYDRRIRQLR